jgi:hypothetical protein
MIRQSTKTGFSGKGEEFRKEGTIKWSSEWKKLFVNTTFKETWKILFGTLKSGRRVRGPTTLEAGQTREASEEVVVGPTAGEGVREAVDMVETVVVTLHIQAHMRDLTTQAEAV